MEIAACPKCGSRNISMGTTNSGVLFGVTSWKSVCKECGYQGEPLLFDTEDDYKKFLRGFTAEKDAKKVGETGQTESITDEEEISQLSQKDKEVVAYLNEMAKEIPPENEKIDEDKRTGSYITKNSLVTLGVILIVIGILLTAVTYGFWFMGTGSLVIVGLILLVAGFLSVKEDQLPEGKSFKSLLAGILLMVSGVLGLFLWLSIFFFDTSNFYSILYSQQKIWFSLEDLQVWFTTCGIIGIIFSLFSLLGGLLAIKRKLWGLALLGGILGLFTLSGSITALIGLILVVLTRKEFD